MGRDGSKVVCVQHAGAGTRRDAALCVERNGSANLIEDCLGRQRAVQSRVCDSSVLGLQHFCLKHIQRALLTYHDCEAMAGLELFDSTRRVLCDRL